MWKCGDCLKGLCKLAVWSSFPPLKHCLSDVKSRGALLQRVVLQRAFQEHHPHFCFRLQRLTWDCRSCLQSLCNQQNSFAAVAGSHEPDNQGAWKPHARDIERWAVVPTWQLCTTIMACDCLLACQICPARPIPVMICPVEPLISVINDASRMQLSLK